MITAAELSRISDKIAAAKDTRAKAMGRIEQIEAQWFEQYGTTDESKIREILDEQRAKAAALRERIDALETELLEIVP